MRLQGLKSVFSYTDFRLYLRDYFSVMKQRRPDYSHRIMALELGFSSPNYIKLVMDGKRNIGLRSLGRLLTGLPFRDREKRYFSSLVFFCQADSVEEKSYHFGILSSMRLPPAMAKITPKEYSYYSKWYNCAVRELVTREKPPVDYKKLAKKLFPAISPAQAEKSVDLLLQLGLIRKKDDGGFEQTTRIIATDSEVTSLGITLFHQNMIDLGKDSISAVDRGNREVSSLTMCVSEKGKKTIKERVQKFEREIMQMVYDNQDADQVYQLNFQFFPLSQDER